MRIIARNELVKWSNTLSCGIQIIDEQHKGLVNLVNDLFNHVTGNEEEEHKYFNKVIQEAVKYVKIHFATEEKIMIATKFQGYHDHKKAHELFILNVVDRINEFKTGKKMTLQNFTKFLKDWILSHVAVMDKQYFEHFKRLATRKADGRLSINASDVAHHS
jgi:hemerythrin